MISQTQTRIVAQSALISVAAPAFEEVQAIRLHNKQTFDAEEKENFQQPQFNYVCPWLGNRKDYTLDEFIEQNGYRELVYERDLKTKISDVRRGGFGRVRLFVQENITHPDYKFIQVKESNKGSSQKREFEIADALSQKNQRHQKGFVKFLHYFEGSILCGDAILMKQEVGEFWDELSHFLDLRGSNSKKPSEQEVQQKKRALELVTPQDFGFQVLKKLLVDSIIPMHKQGVVHLDIKSNNVMISHPFNTIFKSLAAKLEQTKGNRLREIDQGKQTGMNNEFSSGSDLVDWENIRFRLVDFGLSEKTKLDTENEQISERRQGELEQRTPLSFYDSNMRGCHGGLLPPEYHMYDKSRDSLSNQLQHHLDLHLERQQMTAEDGEQIQQCRQVLETTQEVYKYTEKYDIFALGLMMVNMMIQYGEYRDNLNESQGVNLVFMNTYWTKVMSKTHKEINDARLEQKKLTMNQIKKEYFSDLKVLSKMINEESQEQQGLKLQKRIGELFNENLTNTLEMFERQFLISKEIPSKLLLDKQGNSFNSIVNVDSIVKNNSQDDSSNSAYQFLKKCQYSKEKLSPEFLNLIGGLIRANPKERFTQEEQLEQLNQVEAKLYPELNSEIQIQLEAEGLEPQPQSQPQLQRKGTIYDLISNEETDGGRTQEWFQQQPAPPAPSALSAWAQALRTQIQKMSPFEFLFNLIQLLFTIIVLILIWLQLDPFNAGVLSSVVFSGCCYKTDAFGLGLLTLLQPCFPCLCSFDDDSSERDQKQILVRATFQDKLEQLDEERAAIVPDK